MGFNFLLLKYVTNKINATFTQDPVNCIQQHAIWRVE